MGEGVATIVITPPVTAMAAVVGYRSATVVVRAALTSALTA